MMKSLFKAYLRASLILKISIALVLGIIAGSLLGEQAAILAPLGDLLLRLLTFLIIPLILFTLIVGVNQTSIANLGRSGSKVFVYYTVTSAFAIIVGLLVATLLKPGMGMQLTGNETFDVPENPGILTVILGIVPSNIFTAFTEMNLLGIIFTALVFGIAISAMRSSEKQSKLGESLMTTITALNEASLIVLKAILQYVPIGIFAIMANTVGSQGIDTLISLSGMIGVFYLSLLVHIMLYTVFLLLFKVNPVQFFKIARTPMITAFVTQSSTGTLPLTLEAAKNMGISKSLYGFAIPLGATVNMDGAAIRIAVSAVFAANVVGISTYTI